MSINAMTSCLVELNGDGMGMGMDRVVVGGGGWGGGWRKENEVYL